ncbi:DNA polymerase III subunit delta [Botrimarina colliarenosi]|uniref:DNA-directed DNA polymerase n=1 Tax=Botrimarina colliarenosi TaxID=2528001 RepID=A0A5C6AJR3_9BACT|nr:DNA polymerase III subunit delta [Botrimarina colliarenosi]TWT99650.1 DNA polymerase III subunit delta [Botrimarina colliarenosi]
MAKTSATTTGLEYLLAPSEPAGSVVALVGDDGFLKREVLGAVRAQLCGADGDLDWHAFEGPATEWRDIIDAVGQRSLFGGGGKQVALVDDADTFVTRYRDKLEDFAAAPSAGVVVLDVKTLPGNTRLAKAVAASGLVVSCKTPDRGPEVAKHRRDAAKWLTARAASVHQTQISADAVEVLFDLLPMSLGVIDQEVARLALLAGDGGRIDGVLAKENVGGWRTRTAWDLVDAAADGRAADALAQLDRLLLAGEQPIGVLAQLGSTLRKFSAAASHIEAAERSGQRPSLSAALKSAGFAPFKLGDAERQLRQIGRARAVQLADWVLEADLAMKGHNSAPARARIELERLLLRLSREAAAAR